MLGFVLGLASAAVKVAVTPIAVVKDVVDGEPFDTTERVLSSAEDDVHEAFDDLLGD